MQIAVEDHGPGVPPDERLLIFERFARGVLGRPAGHAARAPAWAWPWSTSTSGCTAAGCGWRTGSDGEEGARFVIELPAEQA